MRKSIPTLPIGRRVVRKRMMPDDQTPRATLSHEQRETLRVMGDTLVPGAAEAGIVEFIELQLTRENPWLFLKYRDLPLEPITFYQQALDGIDQLARRRHGAPFVSLDEAARNGIIDLLIEGDPPGWEGPPANEVFTVLRMDAFDAVYATPAGYQRLGVPLAMHIIPEER
jgi:hypothetical protein